MDNEADYLKPSGRNPEIVCVNRTLLAKINLQFYLLIL